jgi:hypothetical protein
LNSKRWRENEMQPDATRCSVLKDVLQFLKTLHLVASGCISFFAVSNCNSNFQCYVFEEIDKTSNFSPHISLET